MMEDVYEARDRLKIGEEKFGGRVVEKYSYIFRIVKPWGTSECFTYKDLIGGPEWGK